MDERVKAQYTIQDAREAISSLAHTCETSVIRKYVRQIEDAERTIRVIDKKRALRPVTRRPGTRPGHRWQAPSWMCQEAKDAAMSLWMLTH